MKLVTIEELKTMPNGTVFSKVDEHVKNKLMHWCIDLHCCTDLTKLKGLHVSADGLALSLSSLSIIYMNEDRKGFRALMNVLTTPILNCDNTLSYAYDYDYYRHGAKEKYEETPERDFMVTDDYTPDDFESDDLFIVYSKEEIKSMIDALTSAISM